MHRFEFPTELDVSEFVPKSNSDNSDNSDNAGATDGGEENSGDCEAEPSTSDRPAYTFDQLAKDKEGLSLPTAFWSLLSLPPPLLRFRLTQGTAHMRIFHSPTRVCVCACVRVCVCACVTIRAPQRCCGPRGAV